MREQQPRPAYTTKDLLVKILTHPATALSTLGLLTGCYQVQEVQSIPPAIELPQGEVEGDIQTFYSTGEGQQTVGYLVRADQGQWNAAVAEQQPEQKGISVGPITEITDPALLEELQDQVDAMEVKPGFPEFKEGYITVVVTSNPLKELQRVVIDASGEAELYKDDTVTYTQYVEVTTDNPEDVAQEIRAQYLETLEAGKGTIEVVYQIYNSH